MTATPAPDGAGIRSGGASAGPNARRAAGPGRRGPVNAQVDESTRQLVMRTAQLLRSKGRDVEAQMLMADLRATTRQRPMVVVAGEDKRGKSSLVNALLGEADLSPVGIESTTGSPIVFRRAKEPRGVIVHFGAELGVQPTDGDGQPVPRRMEVDAAEALRLATVAGNPGNEAAIRSVIVGWPSPLLRHFDLMDTPGVGGLDAGHAELTLRSLRQADALVFVADSLTPIREAELRFLQRAIERIDAVFLVLTKTDAARGWREVLDDDVAALTAVAPRLAGVGKFPVSSKLARRGIVAGGDDAAVLREESGVAALERALITAVERHAKHFRTNNTLRACLTGIGLVESGLMASRRALVAGGAGAAALQQEQRNLAALDRNRAEWGQELDVEVRTLQIEHGEMLSKGLTEIRHRYDVKSRSAKRSELESLPGQLTAEITALADSLNETVSGRLGQFVDALAARLSIDLEMAMVLGRSAESDIREQLEGLELGDTSMKGYDRMSVLSSFSSGHSIGTLLSGSTLGLGTAGILGGPIGLGIAVAIGGVFAFQAFRAKTQANYAAEFRPWMQDQCGRAQAAIANAFMKSIVETQNRLRRNVRVALEARARVINDALNEAKALVTKESSRAGDAVAEVDKELAAVRALRRQVLVALGQVPPGPLTGAKKMGPVAAADKAGFAGVNVPGAKKAGAAAGAKKAGVAKAAKKPGGVSLPAKKAGPGSGVAGAQPGAGVPSLPGRAGPGGVGRQGVGATGPPRPAAQGKLRQGPPAAKALEQSTSGPGPGPVGAAGVPGSTGAAKKRRPGVPSARRPDPPDATVVTHPAGPTGVTPT